MTIGIVGLGLIGGSLAKTIKRATAHNVLGADIAETSLKLAEMMQAIDGRLNRDNVGECDVVLICLYPKDSVDYVLDNAERFRPGALVIDCSGIKKTVCETLYPAVQDKAFTFIGGHPMAGREYSGIRYAKDDLFETASMILTPYPDIDVERLAAAKQFFLEIGFARVVFATPEEHDERIAYTSQMAHILSSAYVRSELAMAHKGFSAGSFQDMTRVARLNEALWAELFLGNREPLLREISGLIERLREYENALRAGDEQALTEILRIGRERKEWLDS